MLEVKAAYRFLATASRQRLEAAAACAPASTVSGLILRSAVARNRGDVTRFVALLNRAAEHATARDLPYVVDLLAATYVALEDRERLNETLSLAPPAKGLESGRTGLLAILAAMEGDHTRSRDLRRAALDALDSSEDSHARARTLQRLALAAYRTGDHDEAMQHALRCAHLSIRIKAYCLAASACSVAYNVHQVVTGDVELALDFASKMAECAELAGNESYEFGALVARYELCAEIADDRLLQECRERLRKRPLPQQYRERFASGVADVLPLAWRGDFAAFRAGVTVLHDVAARTPGEKALCFALRSLAEAAHRETEQARRLSRAALARSSFRNPTKPVPYELRYLRLAHALASATCIIVGDSARGRRMLQTKMVRDWPDCTWCLAVADGTRWENAPARVRGYARVIARARMEAAAPADNIGLTRGELAILRLLADGMNAPEIARETARSVHTIRAHTRSIISKLGVRGRHAAISQARELGFLA